MHANSRWRKRYANVEQELVNRSDWPTISCDVDLGNVNETEKNGRFFVDEIKHQWAKDVKNDLIFSGVRNTLLHGSETIPRRLPIKYNNSMSGSVPNVNKNYNSASDVKLNCVSSQTTIQSDYFTPNENFSFIFTS